jgi:hypothetical protein
MIPLFRSFQSTVTPFERGKSAFNFRVFQDPTTGAPTGIQSESSTGPDGIWAPVDLTAAQIAAPSDLMLADLNATFRLDEAPYTRYFSNGTALVSGGGSGNIAAFFAALPDSDAGLSVGDMFWNGGFLCKKV